MRAIKLETAQILFSSDVFAAVAVVDAIFISILPTKNLLVCLVSLS